MTSVEETKTSSYENKPSSTEDRLIDSQFDMYDPVLSIPELNLVIGDFQEQTKNRTYIFNLWNLGLAKVILSKT